MTPTIRRRVVTLSAAVALALTLALPWWSSGQTPGKAELLWLGQAAWKITTPEGKVIVIDPWITQNPKTPADHKDLAKLGKVDLILITHGHGDHVGDVKALAAMTNAKVYGPAGLIATLIDLGWITPEQGVRFGKGGKVQPLGAKITITQTRAEHSSEVTVTDPATKKSTTHPGGEPAGFIIELENGFKIYHMGDTGLFGDMKLIGEYYKPDLILMPDRRPLRDGPEGRRVRHERIPQAEVRDPDALRHHARSEGHAAGVPGRARPDVHEGVRHQPGGQARVLVPSELASRSAVPSLPARPPWYGGGRIREGRTPLSTADIHMTREQIVAALRELLEQQEQLKVDVAQINLDSRLDRLGFDSLSVLDFLYDVEHRFKVPIEIADLVALERVDELVEYLQQKLAA